MNDVRSCEACLRRWRHNIGLRKQVSGRPAITIDGGPNITGNNARFLETRPRDRTINALRGVGGNQKSPSSNSAEMGGNSSDISNGFSETGICEFESSKRSAGVVFELRHSHRNQTDSDVGNCLPEGRPPIDHRNPNGDNRGQSQAKIIVFVDLFTDYLRSVFCWRRKIASSLEGILVRDSKDIVSSLEASPDADPRGRGSGLSDTPSENTDSHS